MNDLIELENFIRTNLKGESYEIEVQSQDSILITDNQVPSSSQSSLYEIIKTILNSEFKVRTIIFTRVIPNYHLPLYTINMDESSISVIGNQDVPSFKDFEKILSAISASKLTPATLTLKRNWIFVQDPSVQDRVIRSIPSFVTTLNLINDFSGHIPRAGYDFKPSFISKLPKNILILNLNANDLGLAKSEDLVLLAKFIPTIVHELSLAGNHLGMTRKPSLLINFIENLKEKRDLKALNLYQNELGHISTFVMIGILQKLNNTHVISLNLGGNHFCTQYSLTEQVSVLYKIPKKVKNLHLHPQDWGTYPLIPGLNPREEEIKNYICDLSDEERIEFKAAWIINRKRPHFSKNNFFPADKTIDLQQIGIEITREEKTQIIEYLRRKGEKFTILLANILSAEEQAKLIDFKQENQLQRPV